MYDKHEVPNFFVGDKEDEELALAIPEVDGWMLNEE